MKFKNGFIPIPYYDMMDEWIRFFARQLYDLDLEQQQAYRIWVEIWQDDETTREFKSQFRPNKMPFYWRPIVDALDEKFDGTEDLLALLAIQHEAELEEMREEIDRLVKPYLIPGDPPIEGWWVEHNYHFNTTPEAAFESDPHWVLNTMRVACGGQRPDSGVII